MCPLYPILRGTYFPPSPPPSENENILSPQNRTQTKSSPFLYVLLETFKKSRKKFSQSIARAATSQPFSFALTPNPPEKNGEERRVSFVTKCPSVYFNQNLQKKQKSFKEDRIESLLLNSRRGRNGPMDPKGNHHHVHIHGADSGWSSENAAHRRENEVV